jgi:hypothetical protein
VDVVLGEEISTLNGHLIGLYLTERVPPGPSARESIRVVHDQGGVAVAAHPFHPLRGVVRGHRSIGHLIPDLPLDAIDVWYLGSAFTTFPGSEVVALRAALETGRTRAQIGWSWTAAKMPRHVHIQSQSAIRFLQGGYGGRSGANGARDAGVSLAGARGREPMILLHGLMGQMHHWDAVLDRTGHGYRPTAPSLPMRHRSMRSPVTSSVSLTRLDIPRAVIGGNSLGGHVALRLALKHADRVSGLVLTGSSGLFERGFTSGVPHRPDRAWVRRKMEEVF